jgi:hypothetical protein
VGGCWIIGNTVFVVYIWGVGVGGGVGEAGLLDIKYLLYINIYLLRNFYTPNYYYFSIIIIILLRNCGWIGGLDIEYLFYVNAYSLGRIYTPNYYLFWGFLGGILCWFFLGGGGRGGRIGYELFFVNKFIFIEKHL